MSASRTAGAAPRRAPMLPRPARLLLAAVLLCVAAAPSVLDSVGSQPEALALLDDPKLQPGEQDVLHALERGWFEAAKRVLRLCRERGEAVAAMAEVRSAATKIRDEATDVINLMRVGANAEETVVSTAFQWAQRPDYVYLNVKFSSRIDGPVTCLNVDNERVDIGNNTLLFEAVGRQKPKTFRLNLTLWGAVDAQKSEWSFASVGRMSFTLAKAEGNRTMWPRLLGSKTKPKYMHSWYDRQTAIDAELKKERKEKADREKAEREKEEKERNSSSSSGEPSPPPAIEDPPGEGAAKQPDRPAAKGGKKGGKKKAAGKKSKAAKKEEL